MSADVVMHQPDHKAENTRSKHEVQKYKPRHCWRRVRGEYIRTKNFEIQMDMPCQCNSRMKEH